MLKSWKRIFFIINRDLWFQIQFSFFNFDQINLDWSQSEHSQSVGLEDLITSASCMSFLPANITSWPPVLHTTVQGQDQYQDHVNPQRPQGRHHDQHHRRHSKLWSQEREAVARVISIIPTALFHWALSACSETPGNLWRDQVPALNNSVKHKIPSQTPRPRQHSAWENEKKLKWNLITRILYCNSF